MTHASTPLILNRDYLSVAINTLLDVLLNHTYLEYTIEVYPIGYLISFGLSEDEQIYLSHAQSYTHEWLRLELDKVTDFVIKKNK